VPTSAPFTPASTNDNGFPSDVPSSNAYCQDDEECQNLDEMNSTPDNLVYSCPTAKCIGNQCQCSPNCKKDPYTGMCCQGVQTIGSDSFCIENTATPGLAQIKYLLKQKGLKQEFDKKTYRKMLQQSVKM
jgi:hypothetical protein